MVFTRPENALSRANEFIAVNKHMMALEALSEVITSRKHRTWTKIHQPIMEKYLELCVFLRKSDRAKDGLYQYKNICQSVNVSSLEEVMLGYLKLASQKTEEAKKLSQASVDVEDLDSIQSPEGLVRASELGLNIRAQQDKDNYTSWLKFLWESYKQCLDVLKNNTRVELQYKIIAHGALQFALKYQRKFEFRKLCDMIRQHLQWAYKHVAVLNFSIKLDNAESIKYLLETRMSMFDTAVKLDLWQEAFRAVEEIHEIMHQSKLQFTPAQYVSYYWKASQVFWYAGYYACHAYALFRHFVVYRDQKKNATVEELARFASRLVLAVLSVPTYSVQTQIDITIGNDFNFSDKQKDVYHLLDLAQSPSRSQLLQDIEILRITNHLPSDGHIKLLIQDLETNFDPLNIKHKVDDFLVYLKSQSVDANLIQYGSKINEIACMRFLQQASQVYRNITFDRLCKLCPVENNDEVDKQSLISNYVAQMSRSNVIEVRINDKAKSLTFSSDLCAIPPERRDIGPNIQSYPQDIIRSQLQRMSKLSMKIVVQIHGSSISRANRAIRLRVIDKFKELDNYAVVYERSKQIEKLKSIQEKVACRRKENEELAARRLEQMRIKEERQRREAEIKRREDERKNELKRLQTKQNMSYVLQTDFGRKELADKTPDELMNIDINALQQEKKAQEMKAERERQNKLISQCKKIDYSVRACHLEELHLFSQYIQTYLAERLRHRKDVEKDILETAQEERQLELSNKERLTRMQSSQKEFYNKLLDARKQIYNTNFEEYSKRLEDERQRLLHERRVKRKEERRAAWIKQKEEAKARELASKKQEEDEKQRMLQEKRRLFEEDTFNKYKKQLEKTAPPASKTWRHASGASVSMHSYPSKTMRPPSTGNVYSNQPNQWPSKFGSLRQNMSQRTDRSPMDRSKGSLYSSNKIDITKIQSWRQGNN